ERRRGWRRSGEYGRPSALAPKQEEGDQTDHGGDHRPDDPGPVAERGHGEDADGQEGAATGADGGDQDGSAETPATGQQVGDPGQNQGADDGDGDIRIWRHGRSFRMVRRLGVESDSILPRWGGDRKST